MFNHKQLFSLLPKSLTIILILTVLINSAACPTNAHALGVLITVTTTSDNTNYDTVCSLREAITNANNNSAIYPDCGSGLANDVIVFDDALGTAQIALSSTLPDITDTWGLTINGGGDITVNGTGHRVFVNFNTGAALKLNGLAVIFGTATFNINNFLGGGGIVNVGTLIITNSTFSNNYAASVNLDHGAAIDNEWGTVSITNSTFDNNEAHYGGAIYNASGATANISNSTFTQNDAFPDTASGNGGFGGAIYNSGIMNLKNNTISLNPATAYRGGGIYNGPGGQTILNFFNNVIANNPGGDCVNVSTIASGNNNLIESTGSDACGLTNGLSGNIIGSNPNLGLLTGSPAYLPLLAGSPAIDAGDDVICAAVPISNTSQNGVTRPQGSHCDIGAYELIPVPVFIDVPFSYWANSYIERLYHAGITSGCSVSPLNYCPDNTVSRDQMAVFLERGIHGSSFVPPNVAPTFSDTAGNFAEDWIEALKNDGITSGCGIGIYCPTSGVTRAQMAIFLERAMHGSSFVPPNVTPTFGDTSGNFAEDWIEALKNDGITSGCGGGNYCPDAVVTRAQMAIFLVKAFGLP